MKNLQFNNKEIEIVDSDLGFRDGNTIVALQSSEYRVIHAIIEFDWDWNDEETERVIDGFDLIKTEAFVGGSEVEVLGYERLEVSRFVDSSDVKEYIQKSIN